MDYSEFLDKKNTAIQNLGFDVEGGALNDKLFPFQKHIVKLALKKGRYAVFADCGLGKTFIQLEWAKQISNREKLPVLILAPLAVSGQTIEEGRKFGIDVQRHPFGNIQITNYEQLENVDADAYCGIVLDESSILKNFEGKTKKAIIDAFKYTPFRLACTATPSPNDPMELGNHSEFLGYMKRNEMLAMYFVHDGGQTSKWRIKGHAQDNFYGWISTWATMINKPSDIGFSDEGYCLPDLNYIEHRVKTKQRNNGMLFNDVAVSATDFNKELRLTKNERLNLAASIVNKSNESFIVWVKQNEEADYIKKLIPDAVEVRGNETQKSKESKLLGFARNEFRVLVTKSKIAQFGLNYQNCHNQIFASLDFSFESLYQSIRRSYRFGQYQMVNIYMITTDTMQNVLQSIKEKQKKFKVMQDKMSKEINVKHSHKPSKVDKVQLNGCTLIHGDCVVESQGINDVDFIIYSPPFAELYTYSDHPEDMGNSKSYGQFVEHFNFLANELYRMLTPGRIMAVHCMDLPIQKGKEGYIGLRDFSGILLKIFDRFIYHSRVTIWKNPVTEMQRTKALGLLHKQLKKDSTMSRVGIPDYVLVFRKPGENLKPVKTNIPVELWQKWASPVWMDIDYGNTLNFRSGREEKDEKHIAPLQLGTIERLIHLYSNEGDVVFSPFMGIGSEVYMATKLNRKGIGIELKRSYFDLAVKNVQSAIEEKQQLSII